MKLSIRTLRRSAAIPGCGKALVLCDEGGRMLPMQASVSVGQSVGEMTAVTVTFHVDGRDVSLDTELEPVT